MLREDLVRRENGGKAAVGGFNVTGYHREGEVVQEVGKKVWAVIEFVIAESEGIEAELVKCSSDLGGLVDRIEKGSLGPGSVGIDEGWRK